MDWRTAWEMGLRNRNQLEISRYLSAGIYWAIPWPRRNFISDYIFGLLQMQENANIGEKETAQEDQNVRSYSSYNSSFEWVLFLLVYNPKRSLGQMLSQYSATTLCSIDELWFSMSILNVNY